MNWNFINTTAVNMTQVGEDLMNTGLNATYNAVQTYAPWLGGTTGFFGFVFSAIVLAIALQTNKSMIAILSITLMVSSFFQIIIRSEILGIFLIIFAVAFAVISYRAFIKSD